MLLGTGTRRRPSSFLTTRIGIHYEGLIALDPPHCEAVAILPLELIEIWNETTGARVSPYVIQGERGSRCCVLNGAAARTCQVGDELIIAARARGLRRSLCFCVEDRDLL